MSTLLPSATPQWWLCHNPTARPGFARCRRRDGLAALAALHSCGGTEIRYGEFRRGQSANRRTARNSFGAAVAHPSANPRRFARHPRERRQIGISSLLFPPFVLASIAARSRRDPIGEQAALLN